MNRTHIRIFSLLLSLTIVIGVCPITAFATSQTAAEPTETEDIQLPTAPGGKDETVNVTVTVTPNEVTGETTTEKKTADGVYTTADGNDVTYNEITVTLPGKEADGDDQIISSDSSYKSNNGNYHAEGGTETSTGVAGDGSVGNITIGIIQDGKAADTTGSFEGSSESITVPTHEGDKLKSEDAANYDQTTITTETDRTATATVGETTVKVGDPTYDGADDSVTPGDGYYWWCQSYADGITDDGYDGPYYVHYTDPDTGNTVYESVWNIYAKYYNTENSNDEKNESIIGGLFCIDLNTGVKALNYGYTYEDGYGYALVNLEDAADKGYYEEDEAKTLRAIAMNGLFYDGDMSVDSDTRAETNAANVEKWKADLLSSHGIDDSTAKDTEVVGGLTVADIEAMNWKHVVVATQMAIWNIANRSDEITDLATNDEKINALTAYLLTLSDDGKDANGNSKESQILSEDRYIDDMDIVIGSMVKDHENNKDTDDKNDVYNVDLKFSLKVTPSVTDDLIVSVLNGKGEKIATARIAGNDTDGIGYAKTETVNGTTYYVLENLHLQENDTNTTFNLKLEGVQYLEEGVYVFQSRIDDEEGSTSQNLIGKFEGEAEIDLSMQFDLSFNVEEGTVTTTREWRKEWYDTTGDDDDDDDDDDSKSGDDDDDKLKEGDDDGGKPGDDDSDRIPDGGTPGSNVPDDLDNIPDGMPLTNVPRTGDSSGLWVALTALCGAGLLALTATGKKREEEA